MATSRLTALRLARPTEWHTLVRNALERTRSVPAAADYLTEHRWPCSRGLLYRYLHDYPTLADGVWTQAWIVSPASAGEVVARTAAYAQQASEEATGKLSVRSGS